MKTPTMRADEIYGVVDDAIDRVERDGRVPRPASNRPRRTMLPKMDVKRSKPPAELASVNAGNVVYVPARELEAMTKMLGVQTSSLSNLMIRSLLPTMLSYQAATNYARAALKEGLDVEIDFDPGMLDCLMHVGNLNVIMHFVRQSKLPRSVKRRFINKVSDKLAETAVQAMVDVNKLEERKIQMQELQAVVYERSKNKTSHHSSADADVDKVKERPAKLRRQRAAQEAQSETLSRPGVRKSRQR